MQADKIILDIFVAIKRSFALKTTKSHILKLTAAAILFCTAGGHAAKAQEIIMPQRWESALYQSRPIYTQDTVTIRFLGDIMMHQAQIADAGSSGKGYDFSSYFKHLQDKIQEADLTIANMEFTLAGEPYTGYPCFSAPDALADYMADCGTDVFLAANNHIFDKGTAGALRTIEKYRELEQSKGIRFTGLAADEEENATNNPLMIRIKGINLALINCTYGTNLGLGSAWPRTIRLRDKDIITKAMSTAREKAADFIFVLPHWGTEYSLKHSTEQEEFARWISGLGADFIIGAHPHVVQDTGRIGMTEVVYSLGNAVSNMSAPNTQLEFMATVRLVRHENGDMEALPLELEYLWCSRPGGFSRHYTVIPVAEFIGRRDIWLNAGDYDKMISTYEKVRKETGIE